MLCMILFDILRNVIFNKSIREIRNQLATTRPLKYIGKYEALFFEGFKKLQGFHKC